MSIQQTGNMDAETERLNRELRRAQIAEPATRPFPLAMLIVVAMIFGVLFYISTTNSNFTAPASNPGVIAPKSMMPPIVKTPDPAAIPPITVPGQSPAPADAPKQ